MNPRHYCDEKVNRPGSSSYYALLTASADERELLCSLLALHRELNEVLIECKDASVARVKLTWWRQEIRHCLGGQPNHPISHALNAPGSLIHRHLTNNDTAQLSRLEQLINRLIDGVEMDLSQGRYLDWPNLQQYLQLAYTPLVELVLQQLVPSALSPWSSLADLLGQAIGLVHLMRDIGLHLRQGRIYIPMSDLRQFGVTAHQLQQGQYSEHFGELFIFELKRSEGFFEQARQTLQQHPLNRQQRIALRPLFTMAQLYQRLGHKLIKKRQHVLSEIIQLTPLHKAWVAQQYALGVKSGV